MGLLECVESATHLDLVLTAFDLSCLSRALGRDRAGRPFRRRWGGRRHPSEVAQGSYPPRSVSQVMSTPSFPGRKSLGSRQSDLDALPQSSQMGLRGSTREGLVRPSGWVVLDPDTWQIRMGRKVRVQDTDQLCLCEAPGVVGWSILPPCRGCTEGGLSI